MTNKKPAQLSEFKELRRQLKSDYENYSGILYEKLHDDVKKVAELTLGVKEKVDTIEKRTAHTEENMETVEVKMVGMETAMDRMETKMDRMETKLDATFEMTGKLATDVEVIKGDVTIMKRDIEITKQDVHFIKNGLKRKVDQEEFEVLERRVAIVEAKFIPKQT